jgi:hypothetical protein
LFDLVVSSVLSVGLLSSIVFNLTDRFSPGYVIAIKPFSKKRLPEIAFVQLKK